MTDCSSGQQCWLRSSLLSELGSLPRFFLGQPVEVYYLDEQGNQYLDHGIVIGICFNPPYRRDQGWVYWVQFDQLPSNLHLPLPHVDEVHESELRSEVASCC